MIETCSSQRDLSSACDKIYFLAKERWPRLELEAVRLFWGHHEESRELLPPDVLRACMFTFLPWFLFDYETTDGLRIVERLVDDPTLTESERAVLEHVASTPMRIFKVASIDRFEEGTGATIGLRDLLGGETVTAVDREDRLADTLVVDGCLAARVIAEADGVGTNVIHYDDVLLQPNVLHDVIATMVRLVRVHPDWSDRKLYSYLPPIAHDFWLSDLLITGAHRPDPSDPAAN